MTAPVPDRESYFTLWARTHGGYDPATGLWLVRAWLTVTYRLGRPLAARGVSPDAVTAAGVGLTLVVLPLTAAGGRWPLAGVVVVVAAGLLDNLDGCVAVLTGRVTAWGYVLDSVADRLCDGIYLLGLWLLGAPGWLAVAAAVPLVLLEYIRARAGSAGFGDIGVVTVGERPTRVIVTAFALLGAGLAPGLAGLAGTIGAAATFGVCAVGVGQLVRVVHHRLAGHS
ncbi:MAG: CDP-alcohol phosphatidyltransferase family protein [Frankia sp.]